MTFCSLFPVFWILFPLLRWLTPSHFTQNSLWMRLLMAPGRVRESLLGCLNIFLLSHCYVGIQCFPFGRSSKGRTHILVPSLNDFQYLAGNMFRNTAMALSWWTLKMETITSDFGLDREMKNDQDILKRVGKEGPWGILQSRKENRCFSLNRKRLQQKYLK